MFSGSFMLVHMLRGAAVLPAQILFRSGMRSVAAFARAGTSIDRFRVQRTAGRAFASAPRLTDQSALLERTDAFVFDCDGVIWKGDTLIDGAKEALDKLRVAGKRCFFVTNNSTRSRKGFKAKFDALGLNVDAEEILSSSFAAAAYFEMTNFKASGKKVYVIGEQGITDELDLIGVPWVGSTQFKEMHADLSGQFDIDRDVGAVVVGFDRWINYYKIQYAQLCINDISGCEFICTNRDAVAHFTPSQEWAGGGTMVAAVAGCTGREPTVVGKPAPLLIDYLERKFKLDKSRLCMVGDRLDTDVVFGNDNGLSSVLVLSGVTTEARLLSAANQIAPDFYCDDITKLLSH